MTSNKEAHPNPPKSRQRSQQRGGSSPGRHGRHQLDPSFSTLTFLSPGLLSSQKPRSSFLSGRGQGVGGVVRAGRLQTRGVSRGLFCRCGPHPDPDSDSSLLRVNTSVNLNAGTRVSLACPCPSGRVTRVQFTQRRAAQGLCPRPLADRVLSTGLEGQPRPGSPTPKTRKASCEPRGKGWTGPSLEIPSSLGGRLC